MNLSEIQEILRGKLHCPEHQIKTIINVLKVVRHNDAKFKSEIIEIIERDAKNAPTIY